MILPGAYGDIWKDKDGFNFDHNFIPFIVHVLYEKSGSSFNLKLKTIQEQYVLIENCLYLEEYSFIIKSPVYNFEIQQNRIKIDEKTYLKVVDLEDLKLFKPNIYHTHFGTQHYSPFLKTLIVTEEKRKKGEPSGINPKTVQHLKNVISSIVVYKKKGIQLGAFFIEPKNFWCIAGGTVSTYIPDEVHHPSKNCILTKAEVIKCRRFCSAFIKSANSNSWMSLISQRLLRLFYEMKLEDLLVDIMTLFEIAFLSDAETELKYRLAIRCAKFLGHNESETKDIFDRIKISYDLRSNIVHSGKISNKNIKKLKNMNLTLSNLINEIQNYLFETIYKFILNPKVRNSIDSYVFK